MFAPAHLDRVHALLLLVIPQLMQRMYTVVMLAPFGIRPKGTLAVRMLPMAQALVRRGHRVSIVAPPVHNPQDAGTTRTYGGVDVTHIALPTLPGAAGVVQYGYALVWAALARRPDVVHLFKPRGYSGLAALALRVGWPRVPLVIDSDDWEGWGGWNEVLPYPYAARALFAWQERDLPRRADAVTVASRTLQTQVWGNRVAPERVFYVPNGPSGVGRPGTEYHTREGDGGGDHPPTVLVYTRFWEFDVRDLVATFVAIVQQRPAVRLLVVGRGERGEEQQLQALARRAGLAGALDYRGWVEPSALPGLFAASDVALVPMDDTLINRARCSVKLLELMEAEVAVVAAAVGQVSAYIEHAQSGVLVPAGDGAAQARAVVRLLDDAAGRRALGRAAGERVRRVFAWDRLVEGVEAAYGWAIEETRYDRRT